ncbi:MAG: ABC transporter permease [Anaerolineae bacterium]|jgi:ABC-2 type transport system permease protein
MRKVWIIARHEYLVNVRRVGFILLTVLVPLLGGIGLLIAVFFSGQASTFLERQFAPEQKDAGVVDHLGTFTPILPAYQDRYRLFSDEAAGRAAVKSDEITALLIIPQDYVQSGQVILVSKEGGFSAAMLEDSTSVRRFFVDHLLRKDVSQALRQRVADPVNPVLVSLKGEGPSQASPLSMVLSLMLPYFLGLLLVMTIFVSSNYLLRGVADEKTSRVIEILLSSVTARELLAGKILGLGALGLTQVVVWLASAFGLSSGGVALLGTALPLLSRPEVFILALVYYLLGFLVYAVLMGAVGALGTTMQESQQLASLFSLMAAIPLMLGGFMFANPNMPLVRVLSWFPLTAPTMMMLRVPMTEVPMIDIVGSIGMLLVTIPFILWAGAKVFRMGLLMYGKRPTLAQMIRSLREA